MKSIYTFYTDINTEGEQSIVFRQHYTHEFIKIVLQVLGMYNYILASNQNIWLQESICVRLEAPNGMIHLNINEDKKVSLEGSTNQKDIFKIKHILNQFVHFKEEEEKLELATAI